MYFSSNTSFQKPYSITYVHSQILIQFINWGQDYFLQCLCQSTIFCLSFAITEFFLLAIMSYDRYVAICKPLRYATIMNGRVCGWLVVWLLDSRLAGHISTSLLSLNIEFCDSNVIDHFLCDASSMMKISFVQTHGSQNRWLLPLLC